jgi:hypothetical protein
MTQHDLAHPVSRLARVLSEIQGTNGRRRWEPSRQQLMAMRRMTRVGATVHEAWQAINPPVGKEQFRMTARRFAIYFEHGRGSRNGVQWRGK